MVYTFILKKQNSDQTFGPYNQPLAQDMEDAISCDSFGVFEQETINSCRQPRTDIESQNVRVDWTPRN